MKAHTKSLIIIFLVFISASTFAQKKGLDTAIVKTTIYCDHCKKCESCGGRLEKELFFVRGIKRLTLDEKAMALTVVYDKKKISLEKIKVEISKLGFDADEIKADPKAVAKLDDCCKKQ